MRYPSSKHLFIITRAVSAQKPLELTRLTSCVRIAAVLLFCVVAGDHHGFDTHLFGTRRWVEVADAKEEKTTVSDSSPKRPARYHVRSNSTSTTTSRLVPTKFPSAQRPVASGQDPTLSLGIVIPPGPLYMRHPSTSYTSAAMSTTHSSGQGRSQGVPSPYATSPYRSPQVGYASESAWRAVHPPTYHFKHVPISSQHPKSGGPVRRMPPSPRTYPNYPGYSGYLMELRTPTLYSPASQGYTQSLASHSRSHSQSHSRSGSMTTANRLYMTPNGTRLHSSPSSRSLSSRSDSNRSGRSSAPPRRHRPGHHRSASDTLVSSSGQSRIKFAHTRKTSSSAISTAGSLSSHPVTKPGISTGAVDGPRLETELAALARRQQLKEQLKEGRLLTDPATGRRRSLDTLPRVVKKMPSEGHLPLRKTVSRLNMGGGLNDSRRDLTR